MAGVAGVEFLSWECGIEYAMQSLPCRKCAEEGAEGAEEVQKKRCTGSGSEAWMAWAYALKQNFTLRSFTMLEIVLIEWERLWWASILARGNHLQHLLLVIAMGTPNPPAPIVAWPLPQFIGGWGGGGRATLALGQHVPDLRTRGLLPDDKASVGWKAPAAVGAARVVPEAGYVTTVLHIASSTSRLVV